MRDSVDIDISYNRALLAYSQARLFLRNLVEYHSEIFILYLRIMFPGAKFEIIFTFVYI